MPLEDLPTIAVVGADGTTPVGHVFRDGGNGAFVIAEDLNRSALPADVYVQALEPVAPAEDDTWVVLVGESPRTVYRRVAGVWVDLSLGEPPPDLGPYAEAVLADTPLGFWLLNETAGLVAQDSSGSSYDGLYVSGPTLADPGPGAAPCDVAVTFDGSSYVEIEDGAPFRTPNFTAEAWFRTTGDTEGILAPRVGASGPYGYSLFVVSGSLRGEYDTTGGGITDLFSPNDVNDGFWHHAALTGDGDTVRLYLDGIEVADGAQGSPIDYTGGLFAIGTQYANVADYIMDGQIAGVAVYDYALTGERVLAHFDAMPARLILDAGFAAGDTTGWTVSSAWSESPANWVTAAGDGSGQTFLRRPMPTGGRYTETRVFMGVESLEWLALRPRDINGAVYDNGTYGALLRGTGDIAIPWCGGSVDVNAAAVSPAPSTTVDDAVVFGIYVVDATTVEVYINGVMVERQTGVTPQFGAYLTIGVFNGANGHFDYVRSYTKLPF